jgi:hypothetical protein
MSINQLISNLVIRWSHLESAIVSWHLNSSLTDSSLLCFNITGLLAPQVIWIYTKRLKTTGLESFHLNYFQISTKVRKSLGSISAGLFFLKLSLSRDTSDHSNDHRHLVVSRGFLKSKIDGGNHWNVTEFLHIYFWQVERSFFFFF